MAMTPKTASANMLTRRSQLRPSSLRRKGVIEAENQFRIGAKSYAVLLFLQNFPRPENTSLEVRLKPAQVCEFAMQDIQQTAFTKMREILAPASCQSSEPQYMFAVLRG